MSNIREKIDAINVLIITEDPHILVLTEHGLKINEASSITFFQNYNLTAIFCRTQHKSGGVMIFCKNYLNIESVRLNTFTQEMNIEICGIKITFDKVFTLHTFGIYRSPNGDIGDFLTNISRLYNKFSVDKQSAVLFVGDFNIDWLERSSALVEMQDLIVSCNLRQLVNSPTRVDPVTGRQSLLDWVVTNIEGREVAVEVLGTGLSDHFAQLVSIGGPVQPVPVLSSFRDLSQSNRRLLNHLLSGETWDVVKCTQPVENKLESFLDILKYNINLACPERKINLNKPRTDKGWLSKGIIVSSKSLKKLHCQLKNYPTKEKQLYYRNYRKIYFKVIKQAKSNYFSKILTKSSNKCKDAWRLINPNS